MTRKRDRGTVLIFCVVLMASVSTIIMSTADIGQFTVLRQYRVEDEAKLDHAEDAALAIVSQLARDETLIVPSIQNYTIGGQEVRVDIDTGVGTRARMLRCDTTVTGKRSKRRRRLYVGKRGKPSPTWFALGCDADFTPGDDVTVNGDAYFGWDYQSGGHTTTVNGELYAQKDALTDTLTVTGQRKMSLRNITPSYDSADYFAAATAKFSGNQNVTLLLFLAVGSYQTLWYNNGNVTFDVKYSGKGTAFIAGNVVFKKFDRNSASDQGLIIVDGNVDFQTEKFEGFLITNGSVTQSSGARLDVKGGIWANSINIGTNKLTVDFDNFFWNDAQWDKRMRVPGMW